MKKRILFFIESLAGGGAERVLVTLLKHFDYQKYNVTLLTLVDGGVLNDEIKGLPISYETVISPSNKVFYQIWNRLKYNLIYHWLPVKMVNRWIIPQKGVDVYVAFTEGFATKLLSYSLHKKIAWVHIDLKSYPWTLDNNIYLNFQEEIVAYKKYNKVICVSNSVEKVMKDYYTLYNTVTIYNPIDSDDIVSKAETPLGVIIPPAVNIVSVGRLVPQKGYDLLIPIIARLRKEGLDIHLYLIGEGSDRAVLSQLILDNDLNDYVHMFGFLKNPFSLMKQMDFFVCSSRAEGFSLVIAEAMVLGLPVVSMDCAGPNELLDDGKYGLLCSNYDELYKEMRRVISSLDYRLLLSQKAKAGTRRFQIQDSLKALYKEIDM